jgi:hypothetical protein
MHPSLPLNRLCGYAPGFLASHPAIAAAATDNPADRNEGSWLILQYAWERCDAFGWQRLGTYLLIATIASLLLLWPFSRMIAGAKRVLTRSTLFVGSTIMLSAAFLALAWFIMRSGSMILLAGLGVGYVAILFAQTRHIFAASRGAAAGVLACYSILAAGAFSVTELFVGPMPWSDFRSKSQEERDRAFADWQTAKKANAAAASASATPVPSPASNTAAVPANAQATTPAPTPTPPPAPVIAAPDLQALYVQLQKARAELNMTDPVAVARFNEQLAAYNQEKAFVASLAAPKPLAAKVELAESNGSDKAGQKPPGAKLSRK